MKYAIDVLDTHNGLPHYIRRTHVFSDVVELCRNKKQIVLQEYPFRVKYINEKAVDTGGFCHDMPSTFWLEAFVTAFDGENLLVPCIHPDSNMDLFVILNNFFTWLYIMWVLASSSSIPHYCSCCTWCNITYS